MFLRQLGLAVQGTPRDDPSMNFLFALVFLLQKFWMESRFPLYLFHFSSVYWKDQDGYTFQSCSAMDYSTQLNKIMPFVVCLPSILSPVLFC